MIIFILVALLLEILVVVYAMSLGVQDQSVVQYSFKLPGTGWTGSIGMSLLFHLVPLAVVTALVSSWVYLAKRPTSKTRESVRNVQDTKRLNQTGTRSFVNALRFKLHQAPIRSAVIVLLGFIGFVMLLSLLAYPQLIYQTIANAYANNPSLLNFIKGSGSIFAPLGSFVNGAIPLVGPGFRDFVSGLGSSLGLIANLDNPGKYLFFQNAAAWVSAIIALMYSEFSRRGYRYRKGRT